MARQLIQGLEHFYRMADKDRLIEVVNAILERTGGKLYEGFSKIG